MGRQIISLALALIVVLAIDWYVIDGIRGAFKKWRFPHGKAFSYAYWGLSFLLIAGIILSVYVKIGMGIRAATLLVFFLLFIGKLCFLPFIVIDDIRRFVIRRKGKATPPSPKEEPSSTQSDTIPRSAFLMKAGLLAGSLPLAGLTWGIIDGVHNYRVHRQKLYLPNLPKAFDGLTLGQISDIHSGSFYNKKAVTGGVDLLMAEKPDIIFFTGDLVNAMTSEFKDYHNIFSKVRAPLGVYSCTGNHDYGDYAWWPDAAAKKKNFDDLITAHKSMGWDLLMNQNRRLKVDGEEIGILGIENWGLLSRFPKYGKMDEAVKNTDDLPVKLLLSHDPSHWRAEVLAKYPQIDAVFAGHTHGMQFGVRTEHFQWSPIEYIYKEWAGLYREGHQQLYVNVGYGFIGYPGRVGILPEITIFELKASADPALS